MIDSELSLWRFAPWVILALVPLYIVTVAVVIELHWRKRKKERDQGFQPKTSIPYDR
jgi:hypothetical protein